jgi:hypothetical protein
MRVLKYYNWINSCKIINSLILSVIDSYIIANLFIEESSFVFILGQCTIDEIWQENRIFKIILDRIIWEWELKI